MSKLAEEMAGDIILNALMRHNPGKQDFATNEIEVRAVAKVIDQKLSGVRDGLLEIMWDSMGKGFGDKALNERLKKIDGIALRLCESLKVE